MAKKIFGDYGTDSVYTITSYKDSGNNTKINISTTDDTLEELFGFLMIGFVIIYYAANILFGLCCMVIGGIKKIKEKKNDKSNCKEQRTANN